ncbi:Alpha-centractin, partial [Trichinella pseudospiralis]
LHNIRRNMNSYDVIANQPIVIDNGSGTIKAGFAGDQAPKCHFPNYVGRPKHVRVMAGALEGNVFIEFALSFYSNPVCMNIAELERCCFAGSKAVEYRGLLNIRYPMEHGIVQNWNDMELIWQHLYSKDQLQTFPEEHPVLLTEPPMNPSKNRERTAEYFFETFNVPALYISMQAVLSLYSTGIFIIIIIVHKVMLDNVYWVFIQGRTTGVVLDCGDGVTHAVPIFEGFALPHSIVRTNIAGRDVTRLLRLLLRKEGVEFYRSSEFEIVRTIKERICQVSTDSQRDDTGSSDKVQYMLPDGSTVVLGPCRFRAPEVLFRPDFIGEECEGAHECLAYCIQKSDIELRRQLYQNIILSGGSTLFPGFGDRLLNEVKRLAPKDIKIRITAPQERLFSTWIGGSILASLDTFRKMWISKKEYEDDGARVVHRKCF